MGVRHNRPLDDIRTAWPVSRGVPMPKGAVRDVEQLLLRDASGQPIPWQGRPLATWDDGSVMFAFLQWQAGCTNKAPGQYILELASGEATPQPASPVMITQISGGFCLENGPLCVVTSKVDGRPTISITRHGQPVCAGPLDLWTYDAEGNRYQGTLEQIEIVESGPLVGVVELHGKHVHATGTVFLEYTLQLRLDAGRDELELIHTFLNLGDEPDGVPVGEIGLRLPSAMVSGHLVCQNASGQKSFSRLVEFPENPVINFLPTGVRIADVDMLHEDTTGYASYLMVNRDVIYPWVGVRGNGWTAMAAYREGKENWPKRLAVQDGAVEFGLWPSGSDLHNLRQGMARHHHLLLTFFPEDAPAVDLHRYWHQVEEVPNVVVPFAWYQQTQVFGMQHIMPWLPERYPTMEVTLLHSMERGWASGMLGYGDDPNSGYDYTNIGLAKDIIWINNEHDYTSQACIQFWRSGRPNAWKGARVAAEHQVDVDFVRKSADLWKEGGIPAHCARHTTASVYPSHTWTEGLLQYYLTSGDARALEVAQSLGRNVCKYVEEALDVMEIEGRMIGWALIALAALVEVTHDARCLHAAQTLRDSIQGVVDDMGTYDSHGLDYGTGTILTGLGNLYRACGDEQALKLMLTILDWHMANKRNPTGIVWCDQLGPYRLNLTLPVYAYAYHATGEKKYLEEGLRFLRFTGMPTRDATIRGGAKQYRSFMPFLLLAHEAGLLDEMERRA